MLYYTEADLSPLEVPEEQALCIYISGCKNHCADCHYPELQRTDYGDPLKENMEKLLRLYLNYCTCICFMGEGENSTESRKEMRQYAMMAHACGRSTCLYSGRDTQIEDWMDCFDYIKLGSYQSKYGPLSQRGTNQKMYKRIGDRYQDVTVWFWD